MASRLAIQRHRSLVEDEGLVLRDIFQEDFIQLLRFLFHETDRHKDPRFFQLADPLAGDERIRILHRDDHAVDTFFHHEVSARRRLPIVRTWLERHIERRPLRIFCRVSEAVHFRMRSTIYFMPALADDAAIFYEHRPDHRIRTGMSHAAHRELQRTAHEFSVFIDTQKIHLPFLQGGGQPKSLPLFFHPDSNRRLWVLTRSTAGHLQLVGSEDLYHRWGIPPRPEEIYFYVSIITDDARGMRG